MTTLYVQGCSYTSGHEVSMIPKAWPREIAQQKGYQLATYASVAKSNESMFLEFCNHKHNLKRKDKVVFFWSHAERFAMQFGPENTGKTYMESKNFCGCPDAWAKQNSQTMGTKLTYTDDYPMWMAIHDAYLVKTLIYMQEVQDWCVANEVDHYFITVDNYNDFAKVRSYELAKNIKIDESKVFNWPSKQYEYPEGCSYRDWDWWLAKWATMSFVTQWCAAFSHEHGTNYFAYDMKHINESGQPIFASQIKRWMLDPTKNMEYIINNELSYDAGRCFYDIKYRLQNFPTLSSTHWVEEHIKKMITASADFIYEKEQ